MTKLGVDVSKHNGNVDWQAVKNAGYGSFALIRAGYGGDYTNQDDPQFERNVNECERLGIPYGVYLYSYALDTNDAKGEVNHILRLLKKVGKNFKYGVWFDMEDADGYKKKHGMPSNSTLVDICYTFCETVENAGYYVGIYASLSWLNNQLNNSKLDRFDKWVAQWNNTGCTYKKTYSIWQNTSNQMIGGKRFDTNKLIRDFATSMSNGGGTSSTSNSSSSNSTSSNTYTGSSIVDYLKSIGQDSSFANRKKLAAANGISNYTGTSSQNTQLLNILRGSKTSSNNSYYPKYTGNTTSIVDALKAIGVDSSKSNRTKIAKANGISNYTGTASQNTQLLNLLKQGKLKK